MTKIPAKYRKLVYNATVVLVAATIVVSILVAAGVITAEQVQTFFATVTLIVSGVAGILARINVTPDETDV